MFFLRGAYSLADNFSDFNEDFVPPTLQLDRSSSQTNSIPFHSSEDEDDSNGQLQKRNLFQSLQHNPSYISSNASSFSIKSGTSSQAQSDSSELNIMKKKPISSNNSSVPSTYPNHSESPQHNPLMAMTLPNPHDPKRDDFAKISVLLRRKNAIKLKGTHYDNTLDFGQPVTRPKLPANFPSVTSSSKTTNGNDVSSMLQVKKIPEFLSNSTSDGVEVVVYPVEHFSVSHYSYDVPMMQPSVTPTFQSHDSVIYSDDNLDDQQYSSERNNRPGSTPITQPPPLTSTTSPNIQTPPLNSTMTDINSISPKDSSPVRKVDARRKTNMISFLLNLVTPQGKVHPPKTQQWRPPLRSLQRIRESGESLPSDDFTPAPDDIMAWKIEELGCLKRMDSRNLVVAQSRTSPGTLSSRTTAIPKVELRPQLQTLQEGNSSGVATMLREEPMGRQHALQTQLDEALTELRGVQAENKRLTIENQSQQRSISHLKIALDEHDNSLIQLNNELRVATTSLALLNKEKKGWQDTLDSMQHKLNAAERQVRCLDHLTRHKLESRQEAGYGKPKRRVPFASIPASTDVVEAMCSLNEEIYQTCVQFAEGLERTAVFPTKQKPQVQKVLGDHLTAMIEDHAKKTTSGYNMLLMQTVLEVFMTHWCSSIIEAFYPQLESFADLLVQLSAQTTETSELFAICGKQIKIIQSSSHDDSVKFNEWVKDIINELGLLLTMAGLRMKTQSASLFFTKTLTLVEVAYDLRTAMAEKDICGGLEIVIVPPDTPFQDKWMMDAHADPRNVDTDQSQVDFVAGTTGIGLQRKVSERVDGQYQSRMEIELKPKVTLARALDVQNQ